MPDFYGDMAAVANRLLTDKGQLVVFTRITTNFFNPTTGINETIASTFSGYGAAFDYNQAKIDGTMIKRGDIRLLLEAVTTEPKQDDKATIDGDDYLVMNVKPLSPAGTVVTYEVQLRK